MMLDEARIKELMAERGFDTVSELGRRCGLSIRAIHQMLYQNRHSVDGVGLKSAQTVAGALGVKVSQIVTRDAPEGRENGTTLDEARMKELMAERGIETVSELGRRCGKSASAIHTLLYRNRHRANGVGMKSARTIAGALGVDVSRIVNAPEGRA